MQTIEDGINGLGKAFIDTNSEDFKLLQVQILAHSKQQTEEERLELERFTIQIQMKKYLDEDNPAKTIITGSFIKELLTLYGIKNKIFASYIGYQAANLSAVYTGKRKINYDLALKLEGIFSIPSELWLAIQRKNELQKMKQEKKYSLQELLKRVAL